MELILVVLAPFPIGFLVRSRTAAFIAYVAAHSFVFTFQTLNLVLEWASGAAGAFGATFPKYETAEVLAYGVVNLVLFGVGLGLVYLGSRLGSRRRSRRAVDLEPAA
jgi:predicted Na+-dependent transporter